MKYYELTPIYSSRKSFYGKAKVIDHENGLLELLSYDTIVSRCKDGVVEHLGKWNSTTSSHQKEFEKQFAKELNLEDDLEEEMDR